MEKTTEGIQVADYPKFRYLDGVVMKNLEISEGIRLALKVFSHDVSALEVYRPLAQKYKDNIDDGTILNTINIIRMKGCYFDVFAESDLLVSLKASFPLQHANGKVPVIGFYYRYCAAQSTEIGKLSQALLFFVKTLHAMSHLMNYYFNQKKTQTRSTILLLAVTPERIGSVIMNETVIGDAGAALEEELFGGRIIPNPSRIYRNNSFQPPLRILIRLNPKKPLDPGNQRDYEIQESLMRRVLEAVSSLDDRGTVPLNQSFHCWKCR
jgi:hypothetical protein